MGASSPVTSGVEFEDLKKALDETSVSTENVVKNHVKKIYNSADIVNSLLNVEGIDPNAVVHSELSDNDVSENEDAGEPIQRRPMTVEEKEEVEDQMKAASYHRDADDVVLAHAWSFWIDKNVKKGVSEESFMDSLHLLGTFNTSHGFAELMLQYSDELINIHNQSEKCNIRLFKEGILPTREDPVNKTGGQYVVFLPKDRSEVKRLWLDFMISCIGGNLSLRGSINGLVLAMKKRGDTVAVWIDRGCHPSFYTEQKNNITTATSMDEHTRIKYNNHFMHSRQNSNQPTSRQNSNQGSRNVSPFASPRTRRKSCENNLNFSPLPNRGSSPMTFRQASYEPDSRAGGPRNANAFRSSPSLGPNNNGGFRSPQPQRTSRQPSYNSEDPGNTRSPQPRNSSDFRRNTSFDPEGNLRRNDRYASESNMNRIGAYRPPGSSNDRGRDMEAKSVGSLAPNGGARSPNVVRQPSNELQQRKSDASTSWRSPRAAQKKSSLEFEAMSSAASFEGMDKTDSSKASTAGEDKAAAGNSTGTAEAKKKNNKNRNKKKNPHRSDSKPNGEMNGSATKGKPASPKPGKKSANSTSGKPDAAKTSTTVEIPAEPSK
ncbi:hypothetical protein SARC_03859 [Sphaeroforma arctica JP610]|uniref:Uncharacterized protein n=1 Tax=Sphaeroforma arctica JP610 TaxID=667725 RepID=A0A0L0G4B7_9EUKA|nr:hypothetical protein SARC_03859 [Sphaeroforma arctica JP610]KNC83900.1 hypothetical protein SARC_03859 [Sphaeroforma arctica JP610]|eukprot:XP_014157802.1 hypothetical protein SARC_03859 [Sphaeroforma arctica JP610]